MPKRAVPAAVAAAIAALAVVLLGEHQEALGREVVIALLQAQSAHAVILGLRGTGVAVH